MMNNQVLLNPKEVTALYYEGVLWIGASGHTDGVCDINVEPGTSQTTPPLEFRIAGEWCAQIGYFPYSVLVHFRGYDGNPGEITIQTPEGAKKVVVTDILGDQPEQLPAALTEELDPHEVIGISPNSYDVDRAIGDAVNKLQKKFPANVSAQIVETGVVAVASPVGIAYLYVKMKQEK